MQEMLETRVQSLSWEDPLEEAMATCSSTLAWEITRTEESGGLQSTGSQRVEHNLLTEHTHTIYFKSHYSEINVKFLRLQI